MSGGQEKPEGYVFGRPTKYKAEYCQMLVDHMETGLSFESFAGTIDVCRETLYIWEKEYPDFFNAKKRGFAKCQLWWEKKGAEGLWGSKEGTFNTGVWVFSMKNRFKWTDKVEVSGGDENTKPVMLSYKL